MLTVPAASPDPLACPMNASLFDSDCLQFVVFNAADGRINVGGTALFSCTVGVGRMSISSLKRVVLVYCIAHVLTLGTTLQCSVLLRREKSNCVLVFYFTRIFDGRRVNNVQHTYVV